ncbi:hypothetical protein [Thermasporomyces composti]|jgi:hypothetical protein|uniref:Uncharacterized protein n=1 Tax=Thermasporomyces composti TaxID=696763 RepID=A0A3D9VIB6_THECX|nr:hypothetical protein [Thermasporomyces composti]REF37051.1 hypothetical protein DFJ64_2487 [Thermasporomyces composti]
MPEINGPEIVRGAKELIAPEGPYDCIVTAKQAIADAKLDWLDFGVIDIAGVRGTDLRLPNTGNPLRDAQELLRRFGG